MRSAAPSLVAAACSGPSLAALPQLPLPSTYIPDSIQHALHPGNRNDVHGWLWLPWDRPASTPVEAPLLGWWVHHTPEFWTTSPHDFIIMAAGSFKADNASALQGLPFPPAVDLVGAEFVFTPPSPFSLDALLLGQPLPVGHFTNGSFDTPYPRQLMTTGYLTVTDLALVHYLNQSTPCTWPAPVYLGFPRAQDAAARAAAQPDQPLHLFLMHQVYASPDYDQVVHVRLTPSQCSAPPPESLWAAGATFVFGDRSSDVLHRAHPLTTPRAKVTFMGQQGVQITCPVDVLEEVHCVVMPDSFANCPKPTV